MIYFVVTAEVDRREKPANVYQQDRVRYRKGKGRSLGQPMTMQNLLETRRGKEQPRARRGERLDIRQGGASLSPLVLKGVMGRVQRLAKTRERSIDRSIDFKNEKEALPEKDPARNKQPSGTDVFPFTIPRRYLSLSLNPTTLPSKNLWGEGNVELLLAGGTNEGQRNMPCFRPGPQ